MTDSKRKDSPDFKESQIPNDVIIGRAFRWSLLGIVVLLALGGITYLLSRDEKPVESVRAVDVPAPQRLEQSRKGMPVVRFTEVTREAGIDFVHVNGATGEKLLPETMGGGCAFFDFDNDGDADLLFVNSTFWPHSGKPGRLPTMALYQNDGTGRFTDVSRNAQVDKSFYGMGVAAGDYDNDGWVDLFFTAVGKNVLLQNRQGKFVDVTERSGVGGDADSWSTGAAFFDFDGDGDLDLFVGNYVEWSRRIDQQVGFTLNGKDRAYGPPTNFTGTYPYFYRNNGDGTFSDISERAGVRIDNPATGKPLAKTLGVVPVDVNRDGWIDLVVANDTVQNFLFLNEGGKGFREIGMESGLAFDFNGKATGAMGIDAAYYGNSEALGIGMGNFANEMTSFYVSQEDPSWFSDESIGEGIGSQSRLNLTFGLFFFDYDLDGRLDLLQANGHLEEAIHQIQASQQYRQPAQLFWNRGVIGESNFALVPPETTGDLSRPIVGRGAAFADIDGDGDLDVVLTQVAGAPLLLRNDHNLGHRWLRVRLQGTRSNHDGIGSWITVKTPRGTQKKQAMPSRSYLSQVELPVTFGVGNSDRVEWVEVVWPSGTLQRIESSPLNSTLLVREE